MPRVKTEFALRSWTVCSLQEWPLCTVLPFHNPHVTKMSETLSPWICRSSPDQIISVLILFSIHDFRWGYILKVQTGGRASPVAITCCANMGAKVQISRNHVLKNHRHAVQPVSLVLGRQRQGDLWGPLSSWLLLLTQWAPRSGKGLVSNNKEDRDQGRHLRSLWPPHVWVWTYTYTRTHIQSLTHIKFSIRNIQMIRLNDTGHL